MPPLFYFPTSDPKRDATKASVRLRGDTAATPAAGALDQPAFNRDRLKAEKLIDSKVLEQLIRVRVDAGCSSPAAATDLNGDDNHDFFSDGERDCMLKNGRKTSGTCDNI